MHQQLIEQCRMNLPGATVGGIQDEMHETIQDLCRRFYIHDMVIEVPLAISQVVYEVTPEGKDVVRLLDVTHGQLDTRRANYDMRTRELALADLPEASHTVFPLYLTLAVAPTRDPLQPIETWLDDERWRLHFEVIKTGTLARMYGHPAKTYSDAARAMTFSRSYYAKAQHAKRVAATNNQPEMQDWRFPRFT